MKVEKKQLDKVQVELTIEIPQDEFKEYVEKAYRDKKGKINIPGFRKGHAPRQLIEQYYGKDFFYFDAAELCVFPKYVEAIKENEDIKPIAEPKFDVVTLELANLSFSLRLLTRSRRSPSANTRASNWKS